MKLQKIQTILNSKRIIDKLKSKLKADTNRELAHLLGEGEGKIAKWNGGARISEEIIANLVCKAFVAGQRRAFRSAIVPIVEFYPINYVESKQGANWEILPTDKKKNPRESKLKDVLRASQGIYVFYNSEGKVLYVGKTENRNIWSEMKTRYNSKSFEQHLVNHPSTGSEFSPAKQKGNKIVKTKRHLHWLASYFSAYRVHPNLINDTEALLIRAFANDLGNSRMESFRNFKG